MASQDFMAKLESLTPEQRRYIVRMFREAADFVETAIAAPERIGPLVWEAMLAVERKAEGRERRPAA